MKYVYFSLISIASFNISNDNYTDLSFGISYNDQMTNNSFTEFYIKGNSSVIGESLNTSSSFSLFRNISKIGSIRSFAEKQGVGYIKRGLKAPATDSLDKMPAYTNIYIPSYFIKNKNNRYVDISLSPFKYGEVSYTQGIADTALLFGSEYSFEDCYIGSVKIGPMIIGVYDYWKSSNRLNSINTPISIRFIATQAEAAADTPKGDYPNVITRKGEAYVAGKVYAPNDFSATNDQKALNLDMKMSLPFLYSIEVKQAGVGAMCSMYHRTFKSAEVSSTVKLATLFLLNKFKVISRKYFLNTKEDNHYQINFDDLHTGLIEEGKVQGEFPLKLVSDVDGYESIIQLNASNYIEGAIDINITQSYFGELSTVIKTTVDSGISIGFEVFVQIFSRNFSNVQDQMDYEEGTVLTRMIPVGNMIRTGFGINIDWQ